MKFSIFVLLCCAVYVAGQVGLRSVAVKGTLKCGKIAAENVHVRLLRIVPDGKKFKEEEIVKEVLDTRITGPSGMFDLSGNTQGRAVNETTIDQPALAIYHQCDDPKDTKGYRRVVIKFPQTYVAQTRTPKKTHDIGTLNLEITYPGEQHDKNFKPT
uniref:Uncharacterized protein n=1 Tax=Panagrolaimus sp. ES5 TaxID=591445 RepID=A0AC34FJY6_9BILA